MTYPETREDPLRTKLYRKYNYEILPRIDHIRGTTRFKVILERFAKIGVPRIDKNEITRVNEENWDNLIILDGARYDTYKETINEDSGYRITSESHSRGFIRENFSKGNWSDTVVITANPFYNEKDFKRLTGQKPSEKFNTIFQTWDSDWNEEYGTVMPKNLVNKTKTAQKLFPEKRKIIHFMQPHYPFINSNIEEKGYGDAFKDHTYDQPWDRAEANELSHDEVKKSYLENHAILSEHLKDLEKILSGKSIITADHGNFLGENGFYGHPRDCNLYPVRKVPWDRLDQ